MILLAERAAFGVTHELFETHFPARPKEAGVVISAYTECRDEGGSMTVLATARCMMQTRRKVRQGGSRGLTKAPVTYAIAVAHDRQEDHKIGVKITSDTGCERSVKRTFPPTNASTQLDAQRDSYRNKNRVHVGDAKCS